MAIRLSRTVKNETTNENTTGTSKGFDVTGNVGSLYDLEEIEKNKSRTATDTALLVQVSNENNNTEGNLQVHEEEDLLFMNKADAKKYLFNNEVSTKAYLPPVTYTRPVVVWEEGSLDDGNMTNRVESLYEKIEDLNDEINKLRGENV